jgi:hypothetical protein
MIPAKARNASLAALALGNAAATSGSSTTTELPTAYFDAYALRTALLKSYSGKMSSGSDAVRFLGAFFIVLSFTTCGPPGADYSNLLATFHVDDCHQTLSEFPNSTSRSSSNECRGSGRMRPSGSLKTVADSSNETSNSSANPNYTWESVWVQPTTSSLTRK